MKVKYYLLSMAAIGLLTACSGEKKEASTETGKAATETKAEADQPTGDVFIYTSEHRHDKVQPDKAKVLISKKLGSINTNEFAGNTVMEEIWIGDQVQHIANGAFEGCSAMEELSIPNDFKNRMFGMFPNPEKLRKVYLLTTEYYPLPKNCQPNKQCTLYVPDNFLKQFQADEQWCQFGSIEPMSKSKYYTAEGFLK